MQNINGIDGKVQSEYKDKKSDVLLLISNSEGFKPSIFTQCSTFEDKNTDQIMEYLTNEYKDPYETKPFLISEGLKSDNSLLYSTCEDDNLGNTFSTSEDLKPTAFPMFEDVKPDILTLSSFEGKQHHGLEVPQQLKYSPDSTAVNENFTVFKPDLHNELKELSFQKKTLMDNLPTKYPFNEKEQKTYMCDLCCQRFSCMELITQHLEIHSNEIPYEHDLHQQNPFMTTHVQLLKKINTKQVHSKSGLYLHKKLLTEDRLHECDVCHKKFGHKSHLSEHKISIHYGLKPHECDVCHKKFSKKSSLSRHRNIHFGFKPYECDICHKMFGQKGHLSVHKKVHSGDRPYECDVCLKKFGHKSYLFEHKSIHSGIKAYECDICHKKFGHKSNLSEHKRSIHSGIKLHECDYCHKMFCHERQLSEHQVVHSGDRPHKCDKCHKKFCHVGKLLEHQIVHSGDRPHECDLCDKKFFYKNHLSEHKKNIHSGIKPHECDVCHKKFNKKSNLSVHKETIHLGLKQHECDFCHKKFGQGGHLSAHKKIHTRERPHKRDLWH